MGQGLDLGDHVKPWAMTQILTRAISTSTDSFLSIGANPAETFPVAWPPIRQLGVGKRGTLGGIRLNLVASQKITPVAVFHLRS
jgi:hypothetical protein